MKNSRAYLEVVHRLGWEIKNTDPASDAGHELGARLVEEYYFAPDDILKWAERCFQTGRPESEGLTFVYHAVANCHWDKRPDMLLAKSAFLLQRNDLADYAYTIKEGAAKIYPDNTYFATPVAQTHIREGNLKAAIALLEPLHKKNPGDRVLATMLGTAYYFGGDAMAATQVLKPFQESGRADRQLKLTLANAYIRLENVWAAINILEPLSKSGMKDNAVTRMLGNAYLRAGDTQAAIAVLKPLYQNEETDNIAATLLANAYLHDGRPKAAIAILKPMYESGNVDHRVTGVLGNAYISMNDMKALDALRKDLPEDTYWDYMMAKFCYLGDDYKGVHKIVQPYLQRNIEDVPKNLLSIYAASLGDEHPVMIQLSQTMHPESYANLLASRDEWRENPQRAQSRNDRYSTTTMLFELGGVPISTKDRQMAGISPEIFFDLK